MSDFVLNSFFFHCILLMTVPQVMVKKGCLYNQISLPFVGGYSNHFGPSSSKARAVSTKSSPLPILYLIFFNFKADFPSYSLNSNFFLRFLISIVVSTHAIE